MALYQPGEYDDSIRSSTFTQEVQHTKLIYQALESDLQEFCRFVPPVPEHDSVYSTRLWGIILRACSEIDSQLSGMIKVLGSVAKQPNIALYRRYNDRLELTKFELASRFDKRVLIPFEAFANNKSPSWWVDYNAIKHRRLESLQVATLGNSLQAVAALHVILYRQWGDYMFPRKLLLVAGHQVAETSSEMFSVIKTPW